MYKAFSCVAILTALTLGLASGCKDGRATPSSSSDETAGDEGIITRDSEGKEWVTPDAAAARERAEEEGAQDDEETEMLSPMNVPGVDEIE